MFDEEAAEEETEERVLLASSEADAEEFVVALSSIIIGSFFSSEVPFCVGSGIITAAWVNVTLSFPVSSSESRRV